MRLVARLMAALLVATLVLPALGVGSVFAAAADHLSVTVSPGSGTAGSQFDVTVTALDNTDTVDTGYVGVVHFTSSDTGPSTVLPGDYTFQPSDNGTVTFSNGATLTKSGSRTITATDTSDGSINGTSNAVTISAASADHIVLTGSTANLASGTGRTFTATIFDQFDNIRTSDNSTSVSFDQTSGGGSVTGEGTDTASSGVATKVITGQLVGSVTITASAGVLTTDSLTFTVVVGAASQIDLTGSTGTLTAGTTRVLTATIKDAAGNVRTGDNSTIVTFAKSSGAGTVTGLGASTAAAGVATKTVTGAGAGSIVIDATGASITSNTLTFTVVVGAASQIVLSGSTGNLASGATRILTATITDSGGNTITTDNSTVISFDQTTGAGSVTGEGTDIVSAGVATKTLTGNVAGSVTITATGASMTSNTLVFTVVPGAATQIVLTGLATNLSSGATRVLTATLKDAAGNTLTSDSTTIVTFAKSGGAGTVTGLGTDQAAAGVASVTVTGAMAGSIDLDATASAVTSNTLTFTIVPGVATTIVQTGSTANLASGSTRVLTATIYDAAGNVETGDNGTIVTFSKTTGAGTVTGLGGDTATAGVASVTITGALIGSISTHATGASLTSNTQIFTVVVGPAAEIVLSGSTANLASGATRVLTATIVDAAGNVETGDNTTVVTFAKTAGTGTVSGLGIDTAVGGVAQVTVTGVLVGPVTIEASASGLPNSNTLPFTVVVGPLDHIVLSPQTVTVDPGVNQAYTVEAFDAADNTRGDVTGATTLGIVGGTCNNTAHTCQALTMGPHTVTATYLTKTDNAIQTINNLAPDAVDDSGIFINEDAVAFPIDVLNNDSDANGDAFTITSVTQGSAGTVAIALDNLSVTYTPDANVNGADSFTYTITDINGDSDTATVSLTVIALNDAPSFTLGTDPTVLEDAGATTVTGFATGSPGPADESAQTLTYVIDGNTNPGLFAVGFEPAIAPNGDLTFTPADETSGTATITVHLVDSGPNGGGDVNFSATQTFVVNVTIVDDAPVAVADGTPTAYRVKAGVALTVNAAAGVLTNDTDVDTAHNLLTAAVDVQGAHGTVVLNADGSFTYTPTNAVYLGPDTFTYHANDGNSDSNIVSVAIDIYLNHAPTAVGDIVTVVQGSGYTPVDLLTNDNAANPDAPESIKIVSASRPIHGSVTITGGGTGLSYRPGTNYFGSDTFTYTISDGVFTSSASVLVKVPKDTYDPVATAPVQTFSAQTIGTSTVKARLTWTGTDKGYGISRFELWRSVNGHAYTRVLTTTGHQAYMTLNVASSYRFRVRAIDKKANVGAFAYGPKFTVYRYQETTSSATYSSPWTTLNSSAYSGGHAKGTSVAGFDVTFTTLGRTIAFVTDVAPSRGTADVYVDGVLRAQLTLTQSTTKYRYLAYSITFASSAVHSMRIVYTGGPTKRIDADAFVFLR